MTKDIQEIFTDQIDPPAFAMRKAHDRNALFELADNIKQNGLINPPTVRPKNGRFEMVAGDRRWNASKIAGLIKIPCVVRELTDKEVFAIMTAENIERSDVDPVDEAEHLIRHIEMTKETPAEVAKSIRRSEKYVKDRLAVAGMPEYMKDYLKNGHLKLGAALALAQIENERIRESWTHRGVEAGVTVAQAEFQLHDYRANKSMYDGIAEQSEASAQNIEPKPIMFRCSLDDKEYDARMVRYVPIYEGNLELFYRIVSELKKVPAEIETPAVLDSAEAGR